MMRWLALVVTTLAIVVALTACSPPRTSNTATASPHIDLFPTAAEVRLFANPESIGAALEGAFPSGTVPQGGAVLTAGEVETLRSAVTEGPAPDAVMACCIPRHAFVFYDRSGAKLGALTVCFECSCAGVFDAPTFKARDLEWVYWDEGKLAAIVRAHDLPLYN